MVEKIKKRYKRSKSMKILRILHLAKEEVDVDYILNMVVGTRKKILDLLQYLKNRKLIKKRLEIKKQFPGPKKLYIQISQSGKWLVRKKKKEWERLRKKDEREKGI